VKRSNVVAAKTKQPVRKKAAPKPRIGAAKGALVVPDAFFDPLPAEIGFRGE
jgi:hypothetical protein